MVFIFVITLKSRTICVRAEILQQKGNPHWMDIEKESLMLTSLLICICVRCFFILWDFCFTFILRFPLWTIFIISWYPAICNGLSFSSSLVICTAIWNSIIKKKTNEMNNCRILGVWRIYSYVVITVMVLHLFHNNSSDSVHTVIWWSLLGCNIFFTTTSLMVCIQWSGDLC